ncbi:tetratricopeptide repeat protein [Polyangium mundeleinium]|uniref:Tetratricopeptide repeat protein n=1 Tax=Polyangium mundeleinium TaxID=2995306 RepID=A0ABT5ETN5_9BACT|nr:tetratricopeptide repeat protein [Polyangium mundeleinium]MDC0745193.1 tetratricopeptide repeat protein [Polyangium mundeleinium]
MTFEPEALLGDDDGLVLRRFFEWGVGHGFDLAIVQITTPWKRDALIAWAKANVQGVVGIDLREVGPGKRRLWDVLREATAPALGTTSLILHGLEEAEAEERIVAQLNVERDELARGFPLPWLLIVHPVAAQVMERKAPDFVDFAGAWMWEEKPEPLRLKLAAMDARLGVAAPMVVGEPDRVDARLVEALLATNVGDVDKAADLLGQFDMHNPEAQQESPYRRFLEGRLLEARSQYGEARGVYEAVAHVCDAQGDRRGRAAALRALSEIAFRQGRYEEARKLITECLVIHDGVGHQKERAVSFHQLARIEDHRGRFEEAQRLLAAAIVLFDKIGDRAGRRASLHQLASIACSQGQYEEARKLLGEASAAKEEAGDIAGRAVSLGLLARIERGQGHYEEARRLLHESRAIFDRIGNRYAQAELLHLLGEIEADEGRVDEARRRLAESIVIKEEIGDPFGLAASRIVLGQLEVLRGHFTQGRHLVQAAIDAFEALGAGQVEEARSVLRDIDALEHPPTPS